MNQILTLFFVAAAMGLRADPSPEPTNAPASIELHDQYDAPQTLSFPATNLTLLTIADKKGSEQIDGWVAPLKQRFGQQIVIRGLADVSKVPRFLRGMVRSRFQKTYTHPVMMDWTGEAVKALTYIPDKANILLLDGRGRILLRLSGKAEEKSLQDLCAAIDRALAQPIQKPSRP